MDFDLGAVFKSVGDFCTRFAVPLVAGMIATLQAVVQGLPTLFKTPPPESWEKLRVYFEIFIAFPLVAITAYAFASPLSVAITSLVQIVPPFGSVVIEPIAAAAAIGWAGARGISTFIDGHLKRFKLVRSK